MSSFNTGMQMGLTAMQMANENRLKQAELDMQQAREGRAAEEFGWKRDQQAEQKAAREAYAGTVSGLQPTQRTQIQDTYGMTPAQVNQQLASGGITGLQSKLSSYDAPDSYDLQNVPEAPAAGAQPRFTADQVKAGSVNRMDREQALARMAVAGIDTTALRQSHTAQDDLVRSDLASKVMKMSDKEVDARVADLNMSGLPFLYTEKSKNGYTLLRTEADGKTPIAKSGFTIDKATARQLILAQELGDAGFGNEAMTMLQGAHKEIHDHVKGWNDVTSKAATSNNAAQHFSDTRDVGMAHNKVLQNAYNKPNYQLVGTDDKNEPVYMDLSKAPQDGSGVLRLPTGIKPMRQSPTLSDQEKIGYTEALKAISMLPPNAPPSAVDDVYSRHGLDPAKFGGSGGMPAKWPSAPGAGAAQPQARTGGVGLRAQSSFEPQTRDEYLLTQQALLDGYTPVSRGNAMFGAGELLFEDQNGNRRWASQLGMK